MLTMGSTGRSQKSFIQSLSKCVKGYQPYQTMRKDSLNIPKMLIEGVYELNGTEYTIQLTENGWIRNDLFPVSNDPDEETIMVNDGPFGKDHLRHRHRVCHFIRSDSDLSFNKFQLITDYKEEFESIITNITGFPTECVIQSERDIMYGVNQEEKKYCTDIVFTKGSNETHFSQMSAGEKKICKSFSDILNLMYSLSHPEPGDKSMKDWPRLLMMDNVVMHVYFERHIDMINSLRQVFKNQQIFATTHSGILIPRFQREEHDKENELMIDLSGVNY